MDRYRVALSPFLKLLVFVYLVSMLASAQSDASWSAQLSALATPRNYVQKRASSYDRTGGNDDFVKLVSGETITLLDAPGPGNITHIWATIASSEKYHLKKLVLRMFWDDETSPSVEAPIGDFFGLGLGDYFQFESIPLSVASDKALNSFFPMPFRKHARITLTNQGSEGLDAFYFNIDYQALSKDLPTDTLYFHAQYRQAAPAHGWTNNWDSNDAPAVNARKNLDGQGNYVWLEATGQGHFVGVTMSVLQNQDGWWGEGDDMFFVDGEKYPSINGTGSEDYFLGAWSFGDHSFSYGLYGAPVKGLELDSPIPFTKSLKATIEHGHANHRSDNFYSVAYWYQREPHAPFPALPTVEDRIPRIYLVGGPGNGQASPVNK